MIRSLGEFDMLSWGPIWYDLKGPKISGGCFSSLMFLYTYVRAHKIIGTILALMGSKAAHSQYSPGRTQNQHPRMQSCSSGAAQGGVVCRVDQWDQDWYWWSEGKRWSGNECQQSKGKDRSLGLQAERGQTIQKADGKTERWNWRMNQENLTSERKIRWPKIVSTD